MDSPMIAPSHFIYQIVTTMGESATSERERRRGREYLVSLF